MKREKHPGKI